MSFMKLDDCKSIAEVIERNTSVESLNGMLSQSVWILLIFLV